VANVLKEPVHRHGFYSKQYCDQGSEMTLTIGHGPDKTNSSAMVLINGSDRKQLINHGSESSVSCE
jgi:hypothetical protein